MLTQLGSGIAVAVVKAVSYSSDVTPSLGTSICHGGGPKETHTHTHTHTNHEKLLKRKIKVKE